MAMSSSSMLRGSQQRELQSYYFQSSDPSFLGALNKQASIANPLKGLLTSPRWTNTVPSSIPTSMEFYYIGKTGGDARV
jgi:hypothetical protein